MPATASRNYDYVVLHATANAVEFYEDMGFVRVGAITQLVTEDEDNGGSDKPLVQTEIVSSPIVTYYTKKHDETPYEIANVFGVNVWDLIFLNHFAYPSIEPKSYLKAKTKLFIPKKDGADGDCNSQADDTVQWYIAKEDETPKSISSKFNLSCHELIDANRSRLPDLYPCSRLMKGYVDILLLGFCCHNR
jgi:LysM repeat protein